MPDLLSAYDPGTPVEFLPIWLGQVMRVIALGLAASIIGRVLFGMLNSQSWLRQLSIGRRVGWCCVMVFAIQAVIRMIQRFDERVTLEGLPLTMLGLTLAWAALCLMQRRSS